MAISTYPGIRTAIWDLLDIDANVMSTAKTDVLVAQREELLYQELRVRQMETVISSTMTTAGVVALPSDYLEMKHLHISGSPTTPLQRRNREWVYTKYPTRSSDGKPKYFAREGENLIFGPFPDSTYLVEGIYYYKPTAVSGTSSTLSAVLASSPYLLVYSGAAEVDRALGRPQQSQLWEGSYERLKTSLVAASKQEDFSGSALQVTSA